MENIILSTPEQKKTPWTAEIRPKQAQGWLRSLPLGNAQEASQEIYQALFALNRTAVDAQDRFELMELYAQPLASVSETLQVHFARLALPLTPQKKRLADFLSQMHVEMAFGYKCVLRDVLLHRHRVKKETVNASIERAVRFLGQVLLRAYHVYMPHPPGIWRELHALYEFAERAQVQHQAIQPVREEEGTSTISRRYKQALLLGLCGPYQLPPNECKHVHGFLGVWADKALIVDEFEVTNPVGHFLIDLAADGPPIVFPRDVRLRPLPHLRVLNAIGLASTVHSFITRLQKGETPRALDLGTECFGANCLDMLRRMVKFWGLSARRQFSRTKKEGKLSLCLGLNAIHFFTGGQKPFSPPQEVEPGAPAKLEAIDIDLDLSEEESRPARAAEPLVRAQEVFRVDQWRIRDEGAAGLALERNGQAGAYVRIGDLLGIENEATGQWRIGVARWLKSSDAESLEMGAEMLAPSAQPVAVRPAGMNGGSVPYRQALLLPPIPALRKPATLLIPAGICQPGGNLLLLEGDRVRNVKVVELVERTASFEHIVFVDIKAS